MSYNEYNPLFYNCQDTALYHMFIYDVVDSKKIKDRNRQELLYTLLITVYREIENLEKVRNQTILHRNSIFNQSDIAYLREPFLIDGDTIGFTVIRDSITEEEVNDLFEEIRQRLKIPYQFHMANGYYETDFYEEGNHKYFREYAIQYLNTLHKKTKEL